jgi:hypothetical protein
VVDTPVIAFESEDGRVLYYLKSGSSLTGPIWRAPVDGGGEASLVLDEPIFFADFRLWRGNIVYLVKNPEEGPSIKMMDLRTREVTRLADLGRESRPWFGLTVSRWPFHPLRRGRERRRGTSCGSRTLGDGTPPELT